MANYLYNGVELPDINTVWTDKETYPYAVLTEPVENNSVVALYLTGSRYKVLNNSNPANPSFEVLNTGELSMYFCALNDDGLAIVQSELGVSAQVNEFVLAGTTTHTAGGGMQFGTVPLWTSHDILNTDGSVYLTASDPVPVGGSKLTISAGGESSFEYALYNGLKLPKLPEWDKEAYPYAAFDSLDLYENDGSVLGDESLGLLWRSFNFEVCTSRPEFDEYWVNGGTEHAEYHKGADFKGPCSIVNWSFEYDLTPNGRALLEQMGYTSDFIDANFNRWIEGEPRTLRERESTPVNNETNGEFLLWSNTDILKEDGSLYFAGSEPVPVASGEVTDTTATVNFTCSNLWTSDPVYQIKAWVYEDTSESVTWDVTDKVGRPTYDGGFFVAQFYRVLAGTFDPNDFIGAVLTANNAHSVENDYTLNGSYTFTENDMTPLEEGCWGFLDSDFSYMFGLVATGDSSIDGVYLFGMDSGTWTLSWGGGLDTTLPPTWTSNIFAGTSHSESHTFTGLKPNTDYAVYGVIFADGEATDQNATATFRTLEGEALDFSSSTLEVTAVPDPTFASFQLTYTGLPGTSEVFDIVGTLSDGSEIFMGGKASSGDGTIYATTGALEPNTEYTAFFEVYHSGEPTGVTAAVTFTTAADKDPNSFPMGFASGLSGLPVTKEGVDPNRWTQGFVVGEALRKLL